MTFRRHATGRKKHALTACRHKAGPSSRVKLQVWVANQKQKVVILFDGREAAGKAGVIKRIAQRPNTRTTR